MARAVRKIRLSGIFPAAITPHHPKTREADYSSALDLVDFLAAAGVDGICLFGSTGEFINYSFTERQRLLSLAVKRSRVPIIAGVSHSTLSGALRLADEAISAGADAIMLMPPYFFRYGQGEVEQFYRDFARETGDTVPILLYNIPVFTTGIEIPTVRRLFETGRFAGIKDSSGDWLYFEQLLALRSELPFALFGGPELLVGRSLHAGADGIISGCACAIPEVVVAIAREVKTGDRALADSLDARLIEFATRAGQFPWPVAVRRAVELRGQKSGPPAVPLSPANQQALEEFSAWFRAWHAVKQ
jgi:dihydrodipicolinate synthase/N-acetylneuraminate lyase